MKIVIDIEAHQASALKRFAEKVTHEQAQAVLYPHVNTATRSDQAYQILSAFSELEKALADAGVSAWPWVAGL